jgi:hypothetical protein
MSFARNVKVLSTSLPCLDMMQQAGLAKLLVVAFL